MMCLCETLVMLQYDFSLVLITDFFYYFVILFFLCDGVTAKSSERLLSVQLLPMNKLKVMALD